MTAPNPLDDEEFLRAQMLRRHGRLAATLPVVALAMATGLFVVLWSQAAHMALLAWFIAAAAATLGHEFIHLWTARRVATAPGDRRWLRLYRLGALIHGCGWGLSALLLQVIPEGLLHQAVLLTVLTVVAAAVVVGSFDRVAVLAFCLPAALPLLPHFLGHEAGPLDLLALAAAATAATVASAHNRSSFVRSVQDVSAQRARDREVANQARLLQQLVQNTNQGMWFLDNQGQTTDLNEAMCRLLGRPRQQVLGKSVFDFFTDDDLAILLHQLELRKRGHKEGYEIGISRPDGSRVQCFNNATPLLDAAGQKLGSVGMWTDLTPLKNALAAAEAASRAKSEFLSQVSHELRTPLNAILGFAQLLETDLQHPLAPSQQLKVQEMLSGASHLLDLINGLLDLGRIEAGQFSVALRPVALEPLLRECLRLVAPVAQTRGITLQLEAGIPPGLAVHADATRLTQVMVNLLGNAIKYNRAQGRVQVRALVSQERVQIEVQDTGLGLSEQEQQRLFEPFQRLRAEGSGVEGTGIGLALSRRLAQAMSGGLSVRSAPGEGSTFTVDIGRAPDLEPAAAPAALTAQGPAAADHAEPDSATAAPLPATVLYIEDNPVNAMVMEAMVTRIEGLRMLHAEDGLPGLQMAIEHAPQLILTDIQMPGMDGFTLLQHLREHESTRHTPVVAITADATPASLERGRQAGFSDYLTKPVQMEALHKVLRRLLTSQPADEGIPARL